MALEQARNFTEAQYTKTYWREKVKRTDTSYSTVYNIYLSGNGLKDGSITGANAPRTLDEADAMLQALVEDESNEWTYGIIYEVKPVVRRGTSMKRKKSRG